MATPVALAAFLAHRRPARQQHSVGGKCSPPLAFLTQAARELQKAFGQDCPPVFLLNIEHRIYAVGDHTDAQGGKLPDEKRGHMLANVWMYLSETLRSVACRPIPWTEAETRAERRLMTFREPGEAWTSGELHRVPTRSS